MAILANYLVAASVFSAVALAAPLVQRDTVTDIVTETVWTTLDVTTTIYDNALPATAAPSIITTSAMQMTTVETSTTPTSTKSVPTTTSTATSTLAPAAQFFTTSTTTPAAGLALAPTSAAPATSTWTTSTTSTTASAASASATLVTNSISGSTTSNCEGQGAACVGDVTHWDGGLGACGTTVDTNADLAIALPFAFMGTLSNSNPYCGRSVTLYNPTSGTKVQATVRDKCMGCVDRAIDCTNALFNQITDNLGNGRMSGIEWWFN